MSPRARLTNTYLRVAVFNRLLEAAQTPAASRSPAQQAAVAAMEKYIHDKRVYVAQVALDMYKAWKAQIRRMEQRRTRKVRSRSSSTTAPFRSTSSAWLPPSWRRQVLPPRCWWPGAMSAQWTAGALAAAKDVADTAYTAAPLSQVANPLQMAVEAKAAHAVRR